VQIILNKIATNDTGCLAGNGYSKPMRISVAVKLQ